jgi:hypothetical protein
MDDEKDHVEGLLDQLAAFGEARFGDAIREYWFYRGDLCPGCMRRPAGAVKYKGRKALSLNCFMYWERGVLIGYLLCGHCVRTVARKSGESKIHQTIERNLIVGYLLERPEEEGSLQLPS